MSRIQDFDFSVNLLRSLLWQYDKAKNLQGMLEAKAKWYEANQTQFWENWQKDVFDLNTANDFGLSVWSIILNVPLYYGVPGTGNRGVWGFGKYNHNFTSVRPPLNIGYNFGRDSDAIAKLTVEQKRLVLKLRYFQITSDASVTDINRILKLVFGELGAANVIDPLDMSEIVYAFEFAPPSHVVAVLENFDLLPRPAAVGRRILIDPRGRFGFEPYYLNFNNSNFGGAKPRGDAPEAPFSGNFVTGVFVRGGVSIPAESAYTFRRNSQATYYNDKGALTIAAVNEMRLDHDSRTLEALGVLLEDSAVNLMPNPGNQSAYPVLNGAVRRRGPDAPGDFAADQRFTEVGEGTETGLFLMQQTLPSDVLPEGSAAWFSCFLKADTRQSGIVGLFNKDGWASRAQVIADAATGTIKATSGNNPAASIQVLSDNIVRVGVYGTRSDIAELPAFGVGPRLDNSTDFLAYQGDGASGIYTWGWQVEKSGAVSSYIVSGQRQADILTLTAPGINDWVLKFDDGSTQTFEGVNGPFVVPTYDLSRRHIVSFQSTPA